MENSRITESQLLFRLQQFIGADVASVIREVMEDRRILAGLPLEAIAGGWTAAGICAHAKRLEGELQRYREAGEPVYQVKGEKGGEWHDFSKLSFDEFVSMGGKGRILYTTPQLVGEKS